MPHAVDWMFEVLEQNLNRLAGDLHRVLQRPILDRQPKDSSVHVISIGITDVVLHVANDGVMPVGDVERSVRSHDRIGGSEVAVFTVEEFDPGRTPDLAKLPAVLSPLPVELVLLDPQKPDRVADQEILLQLLGEVR